MSLLIRYRASFKKLAVDDENEDPQDEEDGEPLDGEYLEGDIIGMELKPITTKGEGELFRNRSDILRHKYRLNNNRHNQIHQNCWEIYMA